MAYILALTLTLHGQSLSEVIEVDPHRLTMAPVIEPAESEPEPDRGSSRPIKIGAAAGAVIGCLAGPVAVQGRLEAGDRGEHATACLVFAGVGAAIGAVVGAVKAGAVKFHAPDP